MNIIDDLIARIEEYRRTNKDPCKNFATKARAEHAVAEVAQQVANHHAISGEQPSARYVVFFDESWGRWCGAIDLNELLQRKTSTGGYLMFCAQRGFYTF